MVDQVSFPNINSFIDYIEFCPMCSKKTITCGSFKFSFISGQEINITNKDGINITANIYDNTIKIRPYSSTKEVFFNIDKRCNKYHFFYRAEVKIDYYNKIITSIDLHKMHMTIEAGNEYYTINTDYKNDT